MASSSTEDSKEFGGKFFRPDGEPTDLFSRLLRGLAEYISNYVAPKDIKPLTPEKLNEFYRQVGGNYDPLFKATPHEALSNIYQKLGCRHSLQPTDDPFAAPSIPALDSEGFSRWQTVQIRLDPAEHVPYIQAALRKFDVIDSKTGKSFPKDLPADVCPKKPDPNLIRWHDNAIAELANEANGNTADQEKKERLGPPQQFKMPSGRRSSRSPSRSPHRSHALRSAADRSPQHSPKLSPRARSRAGPPQDYFNQDPTSSEYFPTSMPSKRLPKDRGNDSREHGSTRSRRRSHPEDFYVATPATSKYRHDSSEENLHRGGQTPGPAPRNSRPSNLGPQLADSDSDSSSTSSVSSVSDSTPEMTSSNKELSPIHARHLHRTADDDGHPLHSVSDHQHPRSSRDRSPATQRYSYPSPSSSSYPGPQSSSSHDRRHQNTYTVTPNEGHRGSATTAQYANNVPPALPLGGSDSYFQIQPYSFVNRRGGPPRGNYRGANVRFGDKDEVLEFAEDRERRRRHSDERRNRSQFVQSGGKENKVVSGVDGRRYVPDGVIWR